jgi:hypothetical protein
MMEVPDTQVWQELRRLAAEGDVAVISVRDLAGGRNDAQPSDYCVVDVTGGEGPLVLPAASSV